MVIETHIGPGPGTARPAPQTPRSGIPPLPPPLAPRPPLRPAPASFGKAGISAGEDRFYKDTVTLDPARYGPSGADALAQGLGWFSIALGLAEVVAGGELSDRVGLRDKPGLLRAYGVREIGTGVGILAQSNPVARAPWIWGRVMGDVLDLGTLATGLGRNNPDRDRAATAMLVVGAMTVVDLLCAARLGSRQH